MKGRWSLGVWVVALGLSLAGSVQIREVQQRMREKADQAPRVLKAVDANIQFANVPKNSFIDGNPATSVRLFLSVPESFQMAKIPAVVINLASVPPGKVALKLSPDMVRDLAVGAAIERFEPSELVFRLETERRMEIVVAKPGPDSFRLPDGLRLKTVDHRPQTVWAVVRDTSWKTNDQLRVLPVDLKSLPGPGGYEVKGRLNVPASISVEGGDEVTLGVVLEEIP
ncbi:MAG: hypothetical protein HC901_00475 [Bdellovibrionaceae bacterium]|nr:hypothetical protein [Pseudobdellovibrionaceae bacterium]